MISRMHAFALAAALVAPWGALADQHFGNGEVTGAWSTHNNAGHAVGGQPIDGPNGEWSTSPGEIAPACPATADGVNDPRRNRPLCGQPPMRCPNNNGETACPQMMPAHRTYPNCRAMLADGATLVRFGRCDPPGSETNPPPEETHRIAIGFEVKTFRGCMMKVSMAKRLRPPMAPWVGADGRPMKTREFCRRLYPNDPAHAFGEGDGEDDEDSTTDENEG